jgi:tRNA modification GTPase
MDLLLKTYRTGKAVTEGVKTVIAGKPNVGKSSLYNLLAGYDAAIVTDIPGTTRDVLERSVSLGSVMLRLYDTAGIRKETSDRVEAIGIERSIEALDSAELILALFSLEDSLLAEDAEIIGAIEEKRAAKIAVLTKGDLKNGEKSCNGALVIDGEDYSDRFDAIIEISAKESEVESLKALSDVTERLFTDEKIRIGDDAIISSARQRASLIRAKELAESALIAIDSGLPQDAASSDIELSLGAIAELDGRAVREEVTADIFSKFCVGK